MSQNPVSKFITNLRLLFLVVLLQGCGGGSGGGSESDPAATVPLPVNGVAYQGITAAANIDPVNAEQLLSAILGTSLDLGALRIASSTNGARAPSGVSATRISIPAVISALNTKVRALELPRDAAVEPDPQRVSPAAIRVNERDACDFQDGRIVMTGTLENDGTGTLSMRFENCLLGTFYFDGTIAFVVHQFNARLETITEATYHIGTLAVTAPGLRESLGGTIHSRQSLSGSYETLTANTVLRNDISGHAVKTVNLVLGFDYQPQPVQFSHSLILDGRVYDSDIGYVDVQTDAPLYFATSDDEFPDSGGPIVLTGAANSRLAVSPVDPTNVQLDLWTNTTSGISAIGRMPWTELNIAPSGANNPPTADAGVDTDSVKYVEIALDGSGSFDADRDIISFQWRLVDIPAGSAVTLTNASSITPSFIPDLTGNYTIELVVNDGSLDSAADQLVISVLNQAPVATLEGPRTSPMGSSISLSATGHDPDNDPLQTSWSIIDAPDASVAQIQQQDTLHSSFTADIAGSYLFQMNLSDGEDVTSTTHLVSFYRDFDFACTEDADFGDEASGRYIVATTLSFILDIAGICDGWVFFSDQDSKIRLFNVMGEIEDREFILPQRARSLYHNVSRGTLNATSGSDVYEINPDTGVTQTVPMSHPPRRILGKSGNFLLIDSEYSTPSTTLAYQADLENGTSTALLGPFVLEAYSYAFSEGNNKLFVGYKPGGTDNAFVDRYHFNNQTGALSYEATSPPLPSDNGLHSVSAAPDGSRVAYMTGSIAERIRDIDSSSLVENSGYWQGESTPYFSPDGEHLVTTSDSEIRIYNADTYTLVKSHTATCSEPFLHTAILGYPKFSTGGKLVYFPAYCIHQRTFELRWFAFGQ